MTKATINAEEFFYDCKRLSNTLCGNQYEYLNKMRCFSSKNWIIKINWRTKKRNSSRTIKEIENTVTDSLIVKLLHSYKKKFLYYGNSSRLYKM